MKYIPTTCNSTTSNGSGVLITVAQSRVKATSFKVTQLMQTVKWCRFFTCKKTLPTLRSDLLLPTEYQDKRRSNAGVDGFAIFVHPVLTVVSLEAPARSVPHTGTRRHPVLALLPLPVLLTPFSPRLTRAFRTFLLICNQFPFRIDCYRITPPPIPPRLQSDYIRGWRLSVPSRKCPHKSGKSYICLASETMLKKKGPNTEKNPLGTPSLMAHRLDAQSNIIKIVRDGCVLDPAIPKAKIRKIADIATGTGYGSNPARIGKITLTPSVYG